MRQPNRVLIFRLQVGELRDDRGRLGQRVPHDINQLNDVHAVLQRLQNFDLATDLVLLDCAGRHKALG